MKLIPWIVATAIVVPAALSLSAAPLELAPGAAVEAREGDAWSSATFIKREGHKYDVRYSDGTEEWVTVDRIRTPQTAGDQSPTVAAEASKPLSTEGPFMQVALRPPSTGIAKRASASLYLRPTTKPSTIFADLTPAAGTDLGRPDQLIICADAPTKVIAVGERKQDDTPLLCMDINKPGSTEERIFTAHDHRIVSAGSGGDMLVSQPNAGALSLHLWKYVESRYELQANYIFVSDGTNKQPNWACLLTPSHLLIRCDFGDYYLIDLPTHRQIASIKCDNIALHCSGQVLTATKDGAAVLLRPSDLAIIAQLADRETGFGVDSNAGYAAVETDSTIRILKLGSNAPVGRPLTAAVARGRFDLIGPTQLLVDGSIYYDLKTGIPVWKYNAPNTQSVLLANGQMLYVGSIDGQTAACMAALPDESASNAIANVSPDKFLLSPGTHIAISGDLNIFGNAATARANIEHSLTQSGQKADDAATQYKLTFTSAAGPTGKFSVQEFHLETGPLIRSVDAPTTLVTAALTRDDQLIWKKEIKYGAQVMIMRQRDQSLEDAVAKAGQPEPGRLNYLDVPGYIVKGSEPGKVVTLGESTLTRAGFAPSPPAGN